MGTDPRDAVPDSLESGQFYYKLQTPREVAEFGIYPAAFLTEFSLLVPFSSLGMGTVTLCHHNQKSITCFLFYKWS